MDVLLVLRTAQSVLVFILLVVSGVVMGKAKRIAKKQGYSRDAFMTSRGAYVWLLLALLVSFPLDWYY